MKDYNFIISDDRLHKTRFCKKKGGGLTKTFLVKRGVRAKGGLERFRILRGGGLAKKRGVTFLRGGVHTLVPTMSFYLVKLTAPEKLVLWKPIDIESI